MDNDAGREDKHYEHVLCSPRSPMFLFQNVADNRSIPASKRTTRYILLEGVIGFGLALSACWTTLLGYELVKLLELAILRIARPIASGIWLPTLESRIPPPLKVFVNGQKIASNGTKDRFNVFYGGG